MLDFQRLVDETNSEEYRGADVKDGQQRQETQLQQLRSASVKDKSPEEIPSHTIKQMIVHSLCHIDQVTEAFASHPKVLVSALNGPVIGLTAALVAYSDFIYAMPHTYLLAPFASIGISAEGGSTATFTRRMGYTRAAEALMMAKRLTCDEMKSCGFINEVFDTDGLVDRFVDRVLTELDERFGRLDLKSTLQIKSLMRGPSLPLITAHTSLETLLVADRLTQRAISVLSPRDRNSRAKLA